VRPLLKVQVWQTWVQAHQRSLLLVKTIIIPLLPLIHHTRPFTPLTPCSPTAFPPQKISPARSASRLVSPLCRTPLSHRDPIDPDSNGIDPTVRPRTLYSRSSPRYSLRPIKRRSTRLIPYGHSSAYRLHSPIAISTTADVLPIASLEHGITSQDGGIEGDGDQDRSVHEYRCGNDGAD